MSNAPTSDADAAGAQHKNCSHTIHARSARKPSVTAWPLIWLVRLYQVTLGYVMGGHCRFHPSCSHYSIEALQTHGAIKGSWLTIRRILRCHPFGGSGFDPVPPARTER